jgi:hypothetical protein
MVAEMASSVSFATRHSLKCPDLSVSRDTGLFLSQVEDHLLACALRLHRRKAHTLGLGSITAGMLSRGTDHFGISGPQPLFELARAQTRLGSALGLSGGVYVERFILLSEPRRTLEMLPEMCVCVSFRPMMQDGPGAHRREVA